MLQKILWITFSLILCGCGISRPKGFVCQLDAPDKVLLCFDMEKDYDDKGKLKPGVQPKEHPVESLDSIDKATVFDDKSWAEIKIYINKVKAKLEACQNGQ